MMNSGSRLLVLGVVGLVCLSSHGVGAAAETRCGFSNEATAVDVIEACTLAIGAEPGSSEAYRWRAQAHLNRSDYARGLADYDKSIEIKPDGYTSVLRVNALLKRASMLSDKKQYAEAMSDYARVIEYYPSWAGGYGNRGAVLVIKGDYKQALADLDRAIELEPRWKTAYTLRAIAHRELGNYVRATADAVRSESMPDFIIELK